MNIKHYNENLSRAYSALHHAAEISERLVDSAREGRGIDAQDVRMLHRVTRNGLAATQHLDNLIAGERLPEVSP